MARNPNGDRQSDPAEWSGRLLLSPGSVVYTGPGGYSASHSHLATQVIRSPDREFTLWIDGEERHLHSAEIPSRTEHALDARGAEIVLSLIEPMGADEHAEAPIGEYASGAMAYIEGHLDQRVTLTDAADDLGISASRLTHLFTRQVGIPFRRYVLWARLRRVVEEIAGGSNLSRAAVDAGFSDSSHLSRVFKENFGMNPSALLVMEVDQEWVGPSGD